MKTALIAIPLISILAAAPAFADFAVNIGAINVAPDDSSSSLNVIELVHHTLSPTVSFVYDASQIRHP